MTYKVVSRIKTGSKDDGFEYFERGDEIDASDVGGDDAFDELVASKSVMEADEFDRTFPEAEAGVNQPMGTPSNMEQIEGTTLQAEKPEEPDPADVAPAPVVNPADPPDVEGAGTGEGFPTSPDDEDEEEDSDES